MRSVDVVIPVYDGYTETVACLTSVLDTVHEEWARIVLVNDGSPSVQIAEHLRQIAARHDKVVLLENAENLGFVATVNRGMAYDKARDVLLLNSDVEVAGDWLTRMRDAAYLDDDIASVTPFSNNATVCSFPEICEENPLLFGLPPAEVDAAFREEFAADEVFDMPTGVGCCMYLRRDCLDLIGFFDHEAFGRGYGEENDWSQRAAELGKRNLHLANCFIFHHGGVSFREEHSPRLAEALAILDRKYPRYHAEIQEFISRDPAQAARVRAWLRLFALYEKPKILLVCHKLGGGAQQHVDELARELGEEALFLLIVPDKDGRSVRLSCYDRDRRLRDGLFFEADRDYDKLVDLLRGLGVDRVHFHHTLGLPDQLLAVPGALGCDYDVTIHDYFLINANATLTDASARYVSVSDDQFEERCAENIKLPEPIDLKQWRTQQQDWLARAARIIFPSQDCHDRFTEFYALENAVVSWHPDFARAQPYPEVKPIRRVGAKASLTTVPHSSATEGPVTAREGDRPLRVVVIGALSREKGADLLEQIATAMVNDDIEFHLLGYAYRRLGARVHFHGPYEQSNVAELLQKIDPDIAWFPAQWPETYSYTLSIALERGLPVVVPDIGAFAERVRERPHSLVVPWSQTGDQWCTLWRRLVATRVLPMGVEHAPAMDLPDPDSVSSPGRAAMDFYRSRYVAVVASAKGNLASDFFSAYVDNLVADSRVLSKSEWLLRKLWRLSLRPSGARLLSLVPFRLQRTIKRALSQRPMHDIVGE